MIKTALKPNGLEVVQFNLHYSATDDGDRRYLHCFDFPKVQKNKKLYFDQKRYQTFPCIEFQSISVVFEAMWVTESHTN